MREDLEWKKVASQVTQTSNRRKRKVKNPSPIQIGDRDLRILEFVLEMKFASAEDIFLKFFALTYQGAEAKSLYWAKKRILQLERANYLRAVTLPSGNKRFYIASRDAYRLLCDKFPENIFCLPTFAIDSRFFNHDWLVLKARLRIERIYKPCFWISEKQIKRSPEFAFGLKGYNAPDAIYVLKDGRRFAFEMEIAQKGSRIYREKIENYVSLIRSHTDDPNNLSGVHYVVAKKTAESILRAETKLYPEYFKIESLNSFMNSENNNSDEAIDYSLLTGGSAQDEALIQTSDSNHSFQDIPCS